MTTQFKNEVRAQSQTIPADEHYGATIQFSAEGSHAEAVRTLIQKQLGEFNGRHGSGEIITLHHRTFSFEQ